MTELDVEALKLMDEAWRLVLGEDQWAAIIAALEDRDRLRAWMESDYLLSESFAEWAALEGHDG